MKVIIAGSRSIAEYQYLLDAIKESGFDIDTIISGHAFGVDSLGEKFAQENCLSLRIKPAKWKEIDVPGAVIKRNKFGKPYNAVAGHWRNEEMAKIADALILIWDGKSSGSANMKKIAQRYDLKIYEKIIKTIG